MNDGEAFTALVRKLRDAYLDMEKSATGAEVAADLTALLATVAPVPTPPDADGGPTVGDLRLDVDGERLTIAEARLLADPNVARLLARAHEKGRAETGELIISADSLLSLIRYREKDGLTEQTIRDLDWLLPQLRKASGEAIRIARDTQGGSDAGQGGGA